MQSDDSKVLFAGASALASPTLPPEVSAIARRLWPALEQVAVVDRYNGALRQTPCPM